MSIDDLSSLLDAEAEFLGEYPRVVVLDLLSNTVEARENSYQQWGHAMRVCKTLAIQHNIAIFALQHLTKKRGTRELTPDTPVHLGDPEYATQRPANVVLGLHTPRSGRLRVAILKNHEDEAHPAGGVYVDFRTDWKYAKIEEARQ